MSNYLIGSDLLGHVFEVLGAEYTDAFMEAKQGVDDVLKKADSSVNLVQHEAVVPYAAMEASIVEGFRRGVETKDAKLVDDATAAMKALASSARKVFINPIDGSVKSQTKEGATRALVDEGDALQKFKTDTQETLSWVKWAVVIGGAVLVLGVAGVYVVPIIGAALRRRR